MFYCVAMTIDWYGPYKSVDEARMVAKKDYDDCLYMIIGKQYKENVDSLQYIGKSDSLYNRMSGYHHAITELSFLKEMWLGEITSSGIPGPKNKLIETRLDLSEWSHAYFLQLPLNYAKTRTPPDNPVTVLNRWWYKDYESLRSRRPHMDWPDVIDYVGEDYGAKLAWHSGNCCKLSSYDF